MCPERAQSRLHSVDADEFIAMLDELLVVSHWPDCFCAARTPNRYPCDITYLNLRAAAGTTLPDVHDLRIVTLQRATAESDAR